MLVGVIAYLTVPMLSYKGLIVSVFSIAIIPSIMLMWGHFKNMDQRISTGPIIWKYMQQKGFLVVSFLNIGLNLPAGFVDDSQNWKRTIFQAHPNISIAIAFWSYSTPPALFNCTGTSSITKLPDHDAHA